MTPLFCSDAREAQQPISTKTMTILQHFDDVFQAPSGLPPPRSHEHAIMLKEKVDIPNIRPYRYPRYQKAEMEKIIEEMLQIGIIRPSTSPFFKSSDLSQEKGWWMAFLC